MRGLDPEITKKGAHTVLVSTGSPKAIPDFRQTTGFTGPVWTDPSRRVFLALGFLRSKLGVIDPRAAVAAAKALAHGFIQGATQGDPWQHGGVIVVTPKGEVVYRYASRYAGDHPEPADFLAKL